MKIVYHYTGAFFFWVIIAGLLFLLWAKVLKNSRFGDWIFAIKTCVTIFSRKDTELIKRELHFIDTAYSTKAKKRWEHILIVSAYKKRLLTTTPPPAGLKKK